MTETIDKLRAQQKQLEADHPEFAALSRYDQGMIELSYWITRVVHSQSDEFPSFEDVLDLIEEFREETEKPINEALRALPEYREWREEVLKRDLYACQRCGARDNLHAHHITPFQTLLLRHDIQSIEDAQRCGELWDVANGKTLCEDCHKETWSWGRSLPTLRGI